MTKSQAKEIAEIMAYELTCRIARMERDREDPEKYGVPDPWSCRTGRCEYCGIVSLDHEKVENAYEEVIKYFKNLSE